MDPDLVLIDIVLHGPMAGVEAAAIRGQKVTPIVYLSAHSDETARQRLATTRPAGTLVKRFDDQELAQVLGRPAGLT